MLAQAQASSTRLSTAILSSTTTASPTASLAKKSASSRDVLVNSTSVQDALDELDGDEDGDEDGEENGEGGGGVVEKADDDEFFVGGERGEFGRSAPPPPPARPPACLTVPQLTSTRELIPGPPHMPPPRPLSLSVVSRPTIEPDVVGAAGAVAGAEEGGAEEGGAEEGGAEAGASIGGAESEEMSEAEVRCERQSTIDPSTVEWNLEEMIWIRREFDGMGMDQATYHLLAGAMHWKKR